MQICQSTQVRMLLKKMLANINKRAIDNCWTYLLNFTNPLDKRKIVTSLNITIKAFNNLMASGNEELLKAKNTLMESSLQNAMNLVGIPNAIQEISAHELNAMNSLSKNW